MTSPLDKLATVLGRMTPKPWHALHMHPNLPKKYRIAGVRSEECKIYYEKLDPDLLPETHARQITDSEGIALLRNVADKLLDVARVSRRFYTSATGSDASLAEYEQMYAAFTALDAAIESELGTKETT